VAYENTWGDMKNVYKDLMRKCDV